MSLTEKKYVSPLLCWDFYAVYFHELVKNSRAKEDIRQLKSIVGHHLESWVVDKIKEEDYDALVVTDKVQNIQWVSTGFSEMTGYSKSYAIGKTPHFLQGTKTSFEVKNAIKEGIKKKKPVNQSVLNYRKNGAEYLCQIKIIPLLNKNNGLTHYLAFEKELKAA
jgi:PAS domain S-box-containing protein